MFDRHTHNVALFIDGYLYVFAYLLGLVYPSVRELYVRGIRIRKVFDFHVLSLLV
jgi:hypothetical protein